ncbi:helix-turn-helix domain-containing protein [Pseudarthrobacter albicanus]|uniref:helix-turn-helix domain-containing protein n=1 Tax=Pseudarthrobacter albicanus TaxID=2823873 RepID=UPI001BABCAFF|nr:helix-turn-helix domain-containing protein [Pseudarthrobacter albicanus]
MVLSPAEAALRLKISERRVRALLEEGRIPAQRVSGRWVIQDADVSRYQPGNPAGRPLSEKSAWELIRHARNAVAHGMAGRDLSPVAKHRLNQRLARLQDSPDPVAVIRSLLAKRAEKAEFSSSLDDLVYLREDQRIHISGVSHPDSGLLSNSELEAYVSRKDFEAVIKDWFLVKAAAGQRSNVLLHVADDVPDELPPLVIAADLAERPGVREQQAAREILGRIYAD